MRRGTRISAATDLVWTARYGADRHGPAGERAYETAMRALVYLACTQRTDCSLRRNFWIDGHTVLDRNSAG